MLRNLTRFWTAKDGDLVFEIVFDRAWRTGDLDPAAVAIVRCAASLDERHQVAIFEDRPTWFAIDFASGHHVHGTLRRQSGVQIDGVACLTVFADVHYGHPDCDRLFHFDGGMVACPSALNPERRRSPARPRRNAPAGHQAAGRAALVARCASAIRLPRASAPIARASFQSARTGAIDAL